MFQESFKDILVMSQLGNKYEILKDSIPIFF